MVDNKKTLETIKNIEYEIMRNFILCKNYDKYFPHFHNANSIGSCI